MLSIIAGSNLPSRSVRSIRATTGVTLFSDLMTSAPVGRLRGRGTSRRPKPIDDSCGLRAARRDGGFDQRSNRCPHKSASRRYCNWLICRPRCVTDHLKRQKCCCRAAVGFETGFSPNITPCNSGASCRGSLPPATRLTFRNPAFGWPYCWHAAGGRRMTVRLNRFQRHHSRQPVKCCLQALGGLENRTGSVMCPAAKPVGTLEADLPAVIQALSQCFVAVSTDYDVRA